MSTTHAAAGALLASPLVALRPDVATAAALAAMAGGVFPDLDVAVGTHRRTLHFPVYYWVPALLGAAAAVVAPGPTTVVAWFFFLSAAVHSVSDHYGGGAEARPWEGTSDRAVYVHARGRWLPPRKLVRYDGAPEDVVLAVALSVPGLLAFGPPVRTLLWAGLAVSVAYAAVRKRLPDLVGV